jgi:cystathionine beta-lyase/cystathionine gamma-synthase
VALLTLFSKGCTAPAYEEGHCFIPDPAGVLLSKSELEEISELCKNAGTWLVIDNTYEVGC